MLTFLTFVLGLVLGPRSFDLAVAPEVTAVEIQLDGQTVTRLTAPPWSFRVDLGTALVPHQLKAIGYGPDGQRLAEAQQWLNLPRPPVAIAAVLEREQGQPPKALSVSWESVFEEQPSSLSVTFDGNALAIGDPKHIPLPPHSLEETHFLRAEVSFGEGANASAEIAYGGALADEVSTELTAVPVALTEGKELPPLADLQGWFTAGDSSLEVIAAERGKAEVVVVRDEGAVSQLERMERQMRDLFSTGLGYTEGRTLRMAIPLGTDATVRLLFPFPSQSLGVSSRYRLFPSTFEFSHRDAGTYWVLSKVQLREPPREPQQLTEALAVAGMMASERGRRRAVVLVVGRDAADRRSLPPAEVRRYLRTIGVPLAVWSVDSRRELWPQDWRPVIDTSTFGKLSDAVTGLKQELDRQRIVWVKGKYLPQSIQLSSKAHGLVLLSAQAPSPTAAPAPNHLP
ncbi:MAG: hypothetical protein U0002_21860 [Thermoanaerobaculia bacterium]